MQRYTDAVNSSAVTVLVGWSDCQKIFACLVKDFRQVHGRVIGARRITVFCFTAKAEVTLQKWDRLERGGSCCDTMADAQQLRGAFPFKLTFWRRKPSVHNFGFASPFLTGQIPGVRRETLALDTLHGLDLGPTSRISGFSLALIVNSGVLGNGVDEPGLKSGCRRLTVEASKWYRSSKTPGGSRIHRFTPGTHAHNDEMNNVKSNLNVELFSIERD